MFVPVKPMPLFILLSLAALAALAPSAQAQVRGNVSRGNFRVPPTALRQEAGQMAAINRYQQNNLDRAAARGRSGYGGYNAGYYPYNSAYGYGYPDGGGGFLSGTADVISSQGELLNQMEQSKLTHEQVRQAKVDTRR